MFFKNIGYINSFLLRINSLQLVHDIKEKRLKNGSLRFVTGLSQNYPFEEVNDANDFEASKLGGTIEWK